MPSRAPGTSVMSPPIDIHPTWFEEKIWQSRLLLRHHRRGAGSGAAAHARGNEHHVSAGQVVAGLVDHLFGGGAADIGLRTGAETFGHRHAHLDDAFGPSLAESLRIRVGDDEIDALEPGIDHVVDGVTA